MIFLQAMAIFFPIGFIGSFAVCCIGGKSTGMTVKQSFVFSLIAGFATVIVALSIFFIAEHYVPFVLSWGE